MITSASKPDKFGRHGFTLGELLVVIAVVGLLACLLLPATRTSREATRRTECTNGLRKIGSSLTQYHSMHGHFPAAMSNFEFERSASIAGGQRLSGFVLLLPFMDQTRLWNKVSTPTTYGTAEFPAGPAPWFSDYPPWKEEISMLRCPSTEDDTSEFGVTNYAFCIGDMARDIHQPVKLRGAFACRMNSRLEDFIDGTSNTISMAEIATASDRWIAGNYAIHQPSSILDDPSQCFEMVDKSDSKSYEPAIELGSPGRGGRWADGAAEFCLFNTVLRPNSPSCAVGGSSAVDGIYSASSHHPAGVNVLVADGSVRCVNRSIDTGDSTRPTITSEQFSKGPVPSPFGVWGALGTLADGEAVSNDW